MRRYWADIAHLSEFLPDPSVHVWHHDDIRAVSSTDSVISVSFTKSVWSFQTAPSLLSEHPECSEVSLTLNFEETDQLLAFSEPVDISSKFQIFWGTAPHPYYTWSVKIWVSDEWRHKHTETSILSTTFRSSIKIPTNCFVFTHTGLHLFLKQAPTTTHCMLIAQGCYWYEQQLWGIVLWTECGREEVWFLTLVDFRMNSSLFFPPTHTRTHAHTHCSI